MTRRRQVTAAVAVAFAAARLYRRRVRTWLFTWGATPEEAARRLPGDELLERAGIVATRAITIDAPASAVFPWLVQMGSGRGGAERHIDGTELALGLNEDPAHFGHAAGHPLEQLGLRRDGITEVRVAAGLDGGLGDRLVALHEHARAAAREDLFGTDHRSRFRLGPAQTMKTASGHTRAQIAQLVQPAGSSSLTGW